jgi:Bacterial Ig-like domain
MSTASYKEVEALTRWISRVPDFTVTSTVPTHGATNVPVNQTISIVFPIAIDASTVNSTNVTLTPGVARTVSLHTDGRTIIVDPNTNLAASTTYTVTVTSNVRGRYGSSYVPGVQDTISFTTA